jgi:surfeit locus 1 family protein
MRCPRCGKGKLYNGLLKIADRCVVCDLDLSAEDSGDGAATQIEGPVSLEGVIRADGRKSRFTPDNVPEENFWFYVDLPAMASYVGQDPFASWYVEASATPNSGGFPVGDQSKLGLPNDYLQYALT